MARTVFLFLCAALVAVAGYVLYDSTPDEPDFYVNEPGGRLGVEALSWRDVGEQWAAEVTFTIGSRRHAITVEDGFATDMLFLVRVFAKWMDAAKFAASRSIYER